MADPVSFAMPSDPSSLMAIADYLDLDALFECGVDRIQSIIHKSSGLSDELLRMIASMSDPVRQRLLDAADPDAFGALQEIITPYQHQYRSIVRNMLHDSRFARYCTHENPQHIYLALMETRRTMFAVTHHTFCELESMARIDKSLFSPHYRSLATLNRGSQSLSLWSLTKHSPTPVDMYHGVIDFAFSPFGALVVLRQNGVLGVYQESQELYSLESEGDNDGLTVSQSCALTFSTLYPWLREQLDSTASARLWYWQSSKSIKNMPSLSSSKCVCLSADGTSVAYCGDDGEVHTRSVVPNHKPFDIVLPNSGTFGHWELGDVLSLDLSGDDGVLVATYAGAVRVWDVNGATQMHTYELGRIYGETVGHCTLSSDGRFIALGSWEGRITMLKFSDNTVQEVGRMEAGTSILHLDWSPDRLFFAISSYGGIRLIRSQFSEPVQASH